MPTWRGSVFLADNMTFRQLQDGVCDRLNLTSPEARKRVKAELNLRYREVASGVGMSKVRRSTATANTAVGNNSLTYTNIANLLSIYDAVYLKRPLVEVSVNEIREMDAGGNHTGPPRNYAIVSHDQNSVTVMLYPKPTSISALAADVLSLGTDMVDDADEPAFPEDFHDVLIQGACFDESLKMEKAQALTTSFAQAFKDRKSELRYFYAKRAYLARKQTDPLTFFGLTPRAWGAPFGVTP